MRGVAKSDRIIITYRRRRGLHQVQRRGKNDGSGPNCMIRDNAGDLFGTTASGGVNDQGVVFKIDTAGQESVVYHFSGKETAGHRSASFATRPAIFMEQLRTAVPPAGNSARARLRRRTEEQCDSHLHHSEQCACIYPTTTT